MIKCLIVDDESKAREILAEMLKLYCTTVEVIGQANNVASAYKMINELKPDLVLLDIKMPDGSGFDLLNKFKKLDFKVIFITAHEEYAIKAFRFSALDYILKPIDPSDLIHAVEKVSDLGNKNSINEQFQTLKDNFYNSNGQNSENQNKRIVLKTTENIYIIYLKDVVRCQSEKNYTYFYFADRDRIIVSKTLKEFEEILADFGFMRIHRSHLINLKFIDRYEKADGGYLIMTDGSKVEVSHRKKDALLDYIYKLNDL
ncbi:MAG: DNA-binding response regulator [Bacteroidetes bacterium 4572_77]|nr:MAG: DNA-binding response regulator [Bacteroidetes bacterium 4572_77]